MSTKEESAETKEHVRELLSDSLRIRQLGSLLSSLRKDIYITEITHGSPRIKIEFQSSYETFPSVETIPHLPWALISPHPTKEGYFSLTAVSGWTPFREEAFISHEEASQILSSLLDTPPCLGLSEYFLLENVERLQIADFFLFYSEPSDTFPLYRSRQCHRYLFAEEKSMDRCAPCGELYRRIQAPYVKNELGEQEEKEDLYHVGPPSRKRVKKKFLDCKDCEESFKTEEGLKLHECNGLKGLESDFHYFCPECSLQFRFGSTYVDHLFHVHRKDPNNVEICSNEDLQIKCPSCEDQFNDPKELERHRSSQHSSQACSILIDLEENKLECFECAKLFSTHSSFLRHRRQAHNSLPEGNHNRLIDKRCYFCPRHFTRSGKLARHLRESHSEKDLTQIEEIQRHNPKELRICDICGKAVRNMSNHKENAHRGGDILKPCHICGKSVKKISFRGHLVTHQEKSWLCSDCGQGFSHKTYLERHSRIHDPEYKCLPCKFCNKLFGRIDCLKKHLKSAHLGQKDYICSTCGKAFVCKSKLNRHNVVHLNQKNFPCEACNYMCTRLDNLNAHRLKVHSLEKTTTAAVKERLQLFVESSEPMFQASSTSDASL